MKKILQLHPSSLCNCTAISDFLNCNCSFMAAHDGPYQVFINFRGVDTRNNFTGFLNRALRREGISVYIDSEDLWRGQEILPALCKAIQGSKISIPVFSRRYAESKWCLMELTKMVERHQIILPIFFDVEITDVRHQTGSFQASFENHKNSDIDAQTLQSWRDALIAVTGISGYELQQVNGNQSELVNSVVVRVLTELHSSDCLDCLDVAKYPVGLEARVEGIGKHLNYIGICGTQGIGKTTIAKFIYNKNVKNFSYCCFLANIGKEASSGYESLQKKLMESIWKKKVDSIYNSCVGEILIRKRLRGLKVLLVLDDVDSIEQLDALAINHKWFHSESKIIITSKYKYFIKFAKVDERFIFVPQKLDDCESLQLFSQHAFLQKSPPEDYTMLCDSVLKWAKGLPSALEELGCFLFGETDKEVWQEVVRRLKGIHPTEILQELKNWSDNPEKLCCLLLMMKSLFLC